MSGTWSTTGSDPPVDVEFYTVKGSNEFALYYLDPSLQNGIWTTDHVETKKGNQPEISHLTATYTEGVPVPVPATILLSGLGLFGLGIFISRKKNRLGSPIKDLGYGTNANCLASPAISVEK